MFSRNSAESAFVGDKETNTAYFCQVQLAVENYLLHVDMIAPSSTWLPRALTEGILKKLSWAYLKYCQFIW